MERTKKFGVIGALLVFVTQVSVSACDYLEQGTTKSNIQIAQKSLSDSNGLKELLMEKLPVWNDSVNEVDKSVTAESLNGQEKPYENDAAALKAANQHCPAEFKFVEKKANGKKIYRSTDKKSMIRISPETGQWKFVSKFNSPQALGKIESPLTDEMAFEKANNLFKEYNLSTSEYGDYVATGVGEADASADGEMIQPRVIARHVTIFRKVNGIKVWGSQMTATFDLSGKLFRSQIDWPAFELKKGVKVQSREEAVNSLVNELQKKYGELNVNELNAELVYRLDENTMLYEPSLVVSVNPEAKHLMRGFVAYSLVGGGIK